MKFSKIYKYIMLKIERMIGKNTGKNKDGRRSNKKNSKKNKLKKFGIYNNKKLRTIEKHAKNLPKF